MECLCTHEGWMTGLDKAQELPPIGLGRFSQHWQLEPRCAAVKDRRQRMSNKAQEQERSRGSDAKVCLRSPSRWYAVPVVLMFGGWRGAGSDEWRVVFGSFHSIRPPS